MPRPSEREDDRALVRRIVTRDPDALEAVYAKYGSPCYSLARRILRDEALAQDVVQEVFLALWRDADRFDAARGSTAGYLLSMTHHKAVDAVRREETQRRRRMPAEVLDDLASDLPGVHDEVWGVLRRDRLREALGALPPVQREALALSYYGGYTQREIAGITSTPLGTVKTRMLAGMRALRTVLATDNIPDGLAADSTVGGLT